MIPEFMADSVANYAERLDWPDWETRYHGVGIVKYVQTSESSDVHPPSEVAAPTAHRPVYGKSRGSYTKKPNGCDHSQFKAWVHDDFRFRCAGCRKVYKR